MQTINAKKIAGYVFLPRVLPRAKRLFASGFGYIAFLMANVYAMVRLLPKNHPYLQAENINKYGIHHVIGEAANNLVISKKNIDQIIVFAAILSGIVMVALQAALLLYFIIAPAQPAEAQVVSLFKTEKPQTDIALNVMDRVFGIPKFFCNADQVCTDAHGAFGQTTVRTPFHQALHGLFHFYTIGILVIAVMIFLYHILVVTMETATTGSPFGQRFQNIWVPIRLVVALGLLIPLNYGINSGQYIVLYAAKIGSAFATNGWNRFNTTLNEAGVTANNPLGENDALLAYPSPPDITPLVQFMSLVHACAYAEFHHFEESRGKRKSTARPPEDTFDRVKPYLIKNPRTTGDQNNMLELTAATDYKSALAFYNNSDIRIRFGHHDAAQHTQDIANVKPTCGEIRIPIATLKNNNEDPQTIGGPIMMQDFYYTLVRDMWFTATGEDPRSDGPGSVYLQLIQTAHRYMAVALRTEYLDHDDDPQTPAIPMQCSFGCSNSDLPSCNAPTAPYSINDCEHMQPGPLTKQKIITEFQTMLNTASNTAWDIFKQKKIQFQIEQEVIDLGWGGAGVWYNKIAEVNGTFADAVTNLPMPVSYPNVMDEVSKAKMASGEELDAQTQFSPQQQNGQTIPNISASDLTIAKGLSDFLNWWFTSDPNQEGGRVVTGNIFMSVVNTIFGTKNLMAMQGLNAHIHPLAQLSMLGKGIINSTIQNVMGSTLSAAFGGTLGVLLNAKGVGAAIGAIGKILSTTAFIGLTAGVILYYILPFLPFLYFFFAVGEWVKTIFEAMVGAPLWALGHLRIDGEGLPGQHGLSGYLLIFEIFIRPIMSIFGLVAATVIFTAEVRVLHFIWPLVLDNLTGFASVTDPSIVDMYVFEIQRGPIDQFFFTVLYAVIVYMMATSSFKLIDNIPDSIIRWMGAGVSTFGSGEKTDQLIGNMQQYVAISGATYAQKITGATTGLAEGLGGSLQKTIGGITRASQ